LNYNVDYSFHTEHFGTAFIEADDPEQAASFAREYVIEENPDAFGIDIEEIREIN